MSNKTGLKQGFGFGLGSLRASTADRRKLEDELLIARPDTQKGASGWQDDDSEEEEHEDEKDAAVVQLLHTLPSSSAKLAKRYGGPASRLDASVWEAWEEMEGDTDGSGDVAMKIGELSVDKTREDPLGKFIEDAKHGHVLQKTGLTPVWCGGYGQNPGPDQDGHIRWEIDVIRRDGNMCIGAVVPSAVDGELDRRWDSKCFANLSFYWATIAGTLMNGPEVVKRLPTTRIPVYHCNPGDTITVDLKVNSRLLEAKVLSVDGTEQDLFNTSAHRMRLMPIEGKYGTMLETLTKLYYDGRVYDPIDYEMLDATFILKLREELEVGQVIGLHMTGEMTLSHRRTNGKGESYFVGRFDGVPHDTSPAVCISSLHDTVRLRPVWSSKDQVYIEQLRARVVMLSAGEEREFAMDKESGLEDWVILKCLRTQNYDVAVCVQEIIKFCSREAHPAIERKRLEEMEANRLQNVTHYVDDYVSEPFKMPNLQNDNHAWHPVDINEALSWHANKEGDL